MQFKQLPLMHTAEGNIRKVGFELEYSNVGIEESVQIVQELYGGKVSKQNRFLQKVEDTSIGNFTIEFDLTLLTDKKYKKPFDKLNIDLGEIKVGDTTLEDSVENMLESVVGKLFPYEICTPPVACTDLEQFEKLREALYEHHAKGTEAFPTNAFGTHINVEVPATDPQTLLNYLRAFVLLYPWLIEVGETDLARRISPFIDPFPDEYVALILASEYQPDLDKLIEDYHQFNPDRNRPLDMYPLFGALYPEKINNYNDVGKVKPRETFHYRLPNSSVSRPDWSLAREWNNWVEVEKLACNKEKLEQMSKIYLSLKNELILGFDRNWIKIVEQWLT